MSTPTTRDEQTPVTSETTAPPRSAIQRRTGRWIDHWDPEDKTLWEDGGRRTARRNLVLSIFAEFLGFGAWALWSIVVPQLPAAGFDLTVDQMFWLISVPSLVGATLRIPYTFAVPVFGGRNWTIVSALLLLLPTGALILTVSDPTTPFPVLLAAAALAGLGGGNFASSMANISFFFPEKEKGAALGWNAAGGNIGTAAVQLAVPLVIVTGAGVALDRAGLVFIPFILLAAFLAWRWMDNLSTAKADPRSFGVAVHHRHTWIISFIYIGTFGSFIGYAGAFPTLLASEFPQVALPWRSWARSSGQWPGPWAASSPTGWAARSSRSPPSASWRWARSGRSGPSARGASRPSSARSWGCSWPRAWATARSTA
nr:hypothetical protein GCM10025730_28430 [Promicromonospora thailandica]